MGPCPSRPALLDTLYYNIDRLDHLTLIPNYYGITVTHMTDSMNNPDPSSLLTFVGGRVPARHNASPQYHETITLRNSNGGLSAVATYSDCGTGFVTESPAETYLVLNGTGLYAGAKSMVVYFHNEMRTRVVQIYS